MAKPSELKEYLAFLEEAEKRDHRKIGKELDLFHIDDDNPGQIFGIQMVGLFTKHLKTMFPLKSKKMAMLK